MHWKGNTRGRREKARNKLLVVQSCLHAIDPVQRLVHHLICASSHHDHDAQSVGDLVVNISGTSLCRFGLSIYCSCTHGTGKQGMNVRIHGLGPETLGCWLNVSQSAYRVYHSGPSKFAACCLALRVAQRVFQPQRYNQDESFTLRSQPQTLR